MPTLEILSGKLSGKTFTFTEEAKIGKDDTCPIRITDPGVSRFHAQIRREGGAVKIEDLGSSNGTYVNFKKRSKGDKASLKDKDIIFFGRTVSKFWAEAPPDGAAVSLDLLRQTVPIRGLKCPSCSQSLENAFASQIQEAERVEIIRRLGLHQLPPAQLKQLLSQAK